jgi:hypothetical protein
MVTRRLTLTSRWAMNYSYFNHSDTSIMELVILLLQTCLQRQYNEEGSKWPPKRPKRSVARR